MIKRRLKSVHAPNTRRSKPKKRLSPKERLHRKKLHYLRTKRKSHKDKKFDNARTVVLRNRRSRKSHPLRLRAVADVGIIAAKAIGHAALGTGIYAYKVLKALLGSIKDSIALLIKKIRGEHNPAKVKSFKQRLDDLYDDAEKVAEDLRKAKKAKVEAETVHKASSDNKNYEGKERKSTKEQRDEIRRNERKSAEDTLKKHAENMRRWEKEGVVKKQKISGLLTRL
jgi:hypothetical protein